MMDLAILPIGAVGEPHLPYSGKLKKYSGL